MLTILAAVIAGSKSLNSLDKICKPSILNSKQTASDGWEGFEETLLIDSEVNWTFSEILNGKEIASIDLSHLIEY